jgi:protease IV
VARTKHIIAVAVVLLTVSPAIAQSETPHHPSVPQSGLAAESGPGTLWVNPAQMAYDRDPRFALYAERVPGAAPSSLGLTSGFRAFGVGLHSVLGPDGASDWSADGAVAVQLPERIALGLLGSWNLVEGSANFVSWDLSAALRPLPWLGFGAVAQSLGSPDPRQQVQPRTAFGLAILPFGRSLVAGLEVARRYQDHVAASDEVVLAGRSRVLEGLYLRSSVRLQTAPSFELSEVTVGLEAFFGGVGGGYEHGVVAGDDAHQLAWIGTDEPGESFVRGGRRVGTLDLRVLPPYQVPSGWLSREPVMSWIETMELIRRTGDDPGVKGLVLRLGHGDMDWARATSLRRRIEDLVARERVVVVMLGSGARLPQFYVASAANHIALHPAATLDIDGIALELLHGRGLLDMVGLEPEVVRRSEFKTGPNHMTHTAPTPEELSQLDAYVDGLYGRVMSDIGAGRNVDATAVRSWVDGGPYPAEEALELGIVDALVYPDELPRALEQLHDRRVRSVGLERAPRPHSPWDEPAQIALVYVTGVLLPSRPQRSPLGPAATTAPEVISALEQALDDPAVRAVVLRVDSPGGSAMAADDIARAVERVRNRGKPVVVSMGGAAASGGYYISAGADAIWAEHGTMTGSIGTYRSKISAERLLDMIGIRSTLITRGAQAGRHSWTRAWTGSQREREQAIVDATYERFKRTVAQGRGMDIEEVETIAGGRIWSGTDALSLGLVDGLGGLQDAIEDARVRAGIAPARTVGLVSYTARRPVLQSLAQGQVGALAPPKGPLGDVWTQLLVLSLASEESIWLYEPIAAGTP